MKRSANHHAERCRELADILITPLRDAYNQATRPSQAVTTGTGVGVRS